MGKNNETKDDDDHESFASNNSLDDIEIPGLNPLNDSNNAKDDGKILDDSQNYNADFTVTTSKIQDPSITASPDNVITIEDDTQEDTTIKVPQPTVNETSNWPSFIRASQLTTSTPYQRRDGTSKKQIATFENHSKTETPIKGPSEQNPDLEPDSNIVILESPNISPSMTSKRKLPSSSSTEDISSSCESAFLTSSLNNKRRKQKRRRKSNDSLISPSKKITKQTVAETSSSDDKECVSESDSANIFNARRSLKVSPSVMDTPKARNITSSWLSTSTQQKKTNPSLKKSTSKPNKGKKKRQNKTDTPKIRNEDFKKLLAKTRTEEDKATSSDSGDNIEE